MQLFVGETSSNELVEARTKSMGTELTVSTLVGSRLFPHIKFICDPTVERMYNTDARSICGVVMIHCSPPVEIPERAWWEYARKWISQKVSVLRNSKNTEMKWRFMGKCKPTQHRNHKTVLTYLFI
jgi:hypothetical protein